MHYFILRKTIFPSFHLKPHLPFRRRVTDKFKMVIDNCDIISSSCFQVAIHLPSRGTPAYFLFHFFSFYLHSFFSLHSVLSPPFFSLFLLSLSHFLSLHAAPTNHNLKTPLTPQTVHAILDTLIG